MMANDFFLKDHQDEMGLLASRNFHALQMRQSQAKIQLPCYNQASWDMCGTLTANTILLEHFGYSLCLGARQSG